VQVEELDSPAHSRKSAALPLECAGRVSCGRPMMEGGRKAREKEAPKPARDSHQQSPSAAAHAPAALHPQPRPAAVPTQGQVPIPAGVAASSRSGDNGDASTGAASSQQEQPQQPQQEQEQGEEQGEEEKRDGSDSFGGGGGRGGGSSGGGRSMPNTEPLTRVTRVTCCECEDQPAQLNCIDCGESFCQPCWGGQHRRGKRSLHKTVPLLGEMLARAEQPAEPSLQGGDASACPTLAAQQDGAVGDSTQPTAAAATKSNGCHPRAHGQEVQQPPLSGHPPSPVESRMIGPALPPGMSKSAEHSSPPSGSAHYCQQRAAANRRRVAMTPLRLDPEERKLLNLVEGALEVSEYTDKIDVYSQYDKVSRMIQEIFDYMRCQCGLQLANNYRQGQRSVLSKLTENKEFFTTVRCIPVAPSRVTCRSLLLLLLLLKTQAFEVARRYKIMNPQKMRTTYGKLMFLLQDMQNPTVKAKLGGFNYLRYIKTVGKLLEAQGGSKMLGDVDFETATRDLGGVGVAALERADIKGLQVAKRDSIDRLCQRYTTASLSSADIRRVLESVADRNNFLMNNEAPVRRMLEQLDRFDPKWGYVSRSASLKWTLTPVTIHGWSESDVVGTGLRRDEHQHSLQIGKQQAYRGGSWKHYSGGKGGSSNGGAKLSHTHATQCLFVKQTLMLWREISQRMYQSSTLRSIPSSL
jgi:hypothetical protein